jgi:hypothetical protein
LYLRIDLASEVRAFASETFNISWRFIERDAVFAGEDRESLQEQLAEIILVLMDRGERNLVVIANRAIGILRQQYAMRSARQVA